MQGRQQQQPRLFSTVNIEALVPKNHLLRRIDQALDLGFVRDLTAPAYSQTQGRPSIDPETYVRMLLVQGLPTWKAIPNLTGFLQGARNASAEQKAALFERYLARMLRNNGWVFSRLRGTHGEYVFKGQVNKGLLVIDSKGDLFVQAHEGIDEIDVRTLQPGIDWNVVSAVPI